MNSSTEEQDSSGPNGSNGGQDNRSSTIQEIMRSVRTIQQDMDSKLKNMEEKIQRFLDNLDDDHYEKDGWSEEQVQQQQHQHNASKSPKEQQQATMTQ